MGKKLEELVPSDKVMIELGPRTQYNAESQQMDTIEPSKTLDVTYGYFLSVSQDGQGEPLDEYNEKTGYSKTLNRTVKLVGLADYQDQTTDRGEMIPVAKTVGFETDFSRAEARKLADQAAAVAAKKAADEAKAATTAARAQADFDAKQAKLAQAEQQKREAAQKAADLVANKTPAQAKVIANAISESTDKVKQGIDDSGQVSAPVTDAVAKTETNQ